MSQEPNKHPEKDPQGPNFAIEGNFKIGWPIIVIILAVVLYVQAFGFNLPWVGKADSLSTSEFVSAVESSSVKSVNYKLIDGSISGEYIPEGTDELKRYTSSYAGTDTLSALMAAHPDINFVADANTKTWLDSPLIWVIPIVVVGLLLVRSFSDITSQSEQQMKFGMSKDKLQAAERPKVKFSDVAGIDEAVEELTEIRDFLMEPERYMKMGAKIPRGVLLVGPPGTGKTLLAKAVAGEAGVPFFSLSGSDFVEMFVGVGASRVRDLFKKAKEAAPAIIFIDEIDAVGRQRGAGLGGSHDEREQTLNQLLVEMDGFGDKSSVILLAATNRPDILDPALLRPGRFDRQVTVDAPSVGGREKILHVHAANKPLAVNVDLHRLAQVTPGFTGADLANLMNESALLAAREKRETIERKDVDEAMERVMAGPQLKSRVLSERERTIIAYHESGHALVSHLIEEAAPVHKITIVGRGRALGYTMNIPAEDRMLSSKKEMLAELAVMMGGRAAEELFCDDITSGASNDLERATRKAKQMTTRLGMTRLGKQVYGEAQHEVFLGRDYANKEEYSEKTAEAIDGEVNRLLDEAYSRAKEILETHKERMHEMARVLLEVETVEGDAAQALLDGMWAEYHPALADEK